MAANWRTDDPASGHIPDHIQHREDITTAVNDYGIAPFTMFASQENVAGQVEPFSAGALNSHFFCPFIWRVLDAARRSGQERFTVLNIPEIPQAWLSYGEVRPANNNFNRPFTVVNEPFRSSIPDDQTIGFFFSAPNELVWSQVVNNIISEEAEYSDEKFSFVLNLLDNLRIAPVAAAVPAAGAANRNVAPLAGNLNTALASTNLSLFHRRFVRQDPIPIEDARARLQAARAQREAAARAIIAEREEAERVERREASNMLEAQAATGNENARTQIRPRIHELRNAAYRGNAVAQANLERLSALNIPNAKNAVRELRYTAENVRGMIPELQRRRTEADRALLGRLGARFPAARGALQAIERQNRVAADAEERRQATEAEERRQAAEAEERRQAAEAEERRVREAAEAEERRQAAAAENLQRRAANGDQDARRQLLAQQARARFAAQSVPKARRTRRKARKSKDTRRL
jgi:hypothetical protein